MPQDEPKRLYSVVRDRGGEVWMRGRKWWYWQGQEMGKRGGKLTWTDLVRMYGPLGTDAETDRIQDRGILGGRARD